MYILRDITGLYEREGPGESTSRNSSRADRLGKKRKQNTAEHSRTREDNERTHEDDDEKGGRLVRYAISGW